MPVCNELDGDQASREDWTRTLKHTQSAQTGRQLEQRWLHLKLVGKLLNMLNLTGGKGATVPGAQDIGKDDRELEGADVKLVRTAAGRKQYIALDRPDIEYSAKTALQQMSKPTKLMQLRVVKVARYLKNNPRLIWKVPHQQQPRNIDVTRMQSLLGIGNLVLCREGEKMVSTS